MAAQKTGTRKASTRTATKKPAARRAASGKAATAKARESEYAAIRKKGKALATMVGSTDFDAEGHPLGAWKDYLAELDAWAKRYRIRLKTVVVPSGDGAPAPAGGGMAGEAVPRSHTACPAHISQTERTDFVGGGSITIKTDCSLRRQTLLGRCVYSCVGTIVM
jgi:hypothetical protein